MSVSRLLVCLAAMGTVCLGAAARAQPGAAARPRPLAAALQPASGVHLLANEPVQALLGLSPEQKDKIKSLSTVYQKDVQERIEAVRKLPPSEQQAAAGELQARIAAGAGAFGKQLEELLTAAQRDQLKQVNFQLIAPALLQTPRASEELKLDAQQKEQLASTRNEAQAAMFKLQMTLGEKSLAVLTPAQRKQLQDLLSSGAAAAPPH